MKITPQIKSGSAFDYVIKQQMVVNIRPAIDSIYGRHWEDTTRLNVMLPEGFLIEQQDYQPLIDPSCGTRTIGLESPRTILLESREWNFCDVSPYAQIEIQSVTNGASDYHTIAVIEFDLEDDDL